jgi:predicted ATP-dependent endonuclease of OLD family
MTRSKIDVYVIDEPEVHLNWNLEKKLFKFFDNFSKDNDKQIIVTTHSRIVFQPEYTNNVQYLFWSDNKVICDKNIPATVKSKLYEDAVLLISAIEFPETVIFVEDESHFIFFQELSKILEVTVRISICGNSGNVKSICRAITTGNQSCNHYFIIDGDNQGRPKEYPNSLIQLDKYCIENYSLCFSILEKISCKNIKEIKEFIKYLIQTNWKKIFKKDGAMLSCLADKIDVTDLNSDFLDKIDFSELFLEFIKFMGFQSGSSFWAKYLQEAKNEDRLQDVFGERLIQIFS